MPSAPSIPISFPAHPRNSPDTIFTLSVFLGSTSSISDSVTVIMLPAPDVPNATRHEPSCRLKKPCVQLWIWSCYQYVQRSSYQWYKKVTKRIYCLNLYVTETIDRDGMVWLPGPNIIWHYVMTSMCFWCNKEPASEFVNSRAMECKVNTMKGSKVYIPAWTLWWYQVEHLPQACER